MKGFFKIFFASLLALLVFCVIGFFLLVGIAAAFSKDDKPDLGENGILVLDLSAPLKEQADDDFFAKIPGGFSKESSLGINDVVKAIENAADDNAIKGLYIKSTANANGLAVNDELRRAIADFKRSKKFVLAYGATISEGAYYVAAEADRVYTHPQGGLEWNGFATTLTFFKGLLDKLQIQPEIFYAGKFKSATEPYRATKMTDANRLQTSVFLSDMYSIFLQNVALDRHLDTTTLHGLANSGAIQTAHDALQNKLIDGLKYDDEIRKELSADVKQDESKDLNLITMDKYLKGADIKEPSGNDKIALIYAEGEIVDGKGKDGTIGSDEYKALIRKARLDQNVKAIVLRVNSPGGSSLASDMIWREVSLAKKTKPVIISMGTYAASGGYYISCNGNYIFAESNTITGSIGVFSMMINPSTFLGNKLGITFDGVKTAQYADLGSGTRPMTQPERNFMQASVDSVYHTFLSRVAEGRRKSIADIDSIAQGRVWTGKRALAIGLVDKIGTLQDAINYAAAQIKTKNYSIREYPQKKSILDQIMNSNDKDENGMQEKAVKEVLGNPSLSLLKKIKSLTGMCNSVQARLPFEMDMQ